MVKMKVRRRSSRKSNSSKGKGSPEDDLGHGMTEEVSPEIPNNKINGEIDNKLRRRSSRNSNTSKDKHPNDKDLDTSPQQVDSVKVNGEIETESQNSDHEASDSSNKEAEISELPNNYSEIENNDDNNELDHENGDDSGSDAGSDIFMPGGITLKASQVDGTEIVLQAKLDKSNVSCSSSEKCESTDNKDDKNLHCHIQEQVSMLEELTHSDEIIEKGDSVLQECEKKSNEVAMEQCTLPKIAPEEAEIMVNSTEEANTLLVPNFDASPSNREDIVKKVSEVVGDDSNEREHLVSDKLDTSTESRSEDNVDVNINIRECSVNVTPVSENDSIGESSPVYDKAPSPLVEYGQVSKEQVLTNSLELRPISNSDSKSQQKVILCQNQLDNNSVDCTEFDQAIKADVELVDDNTNSSDRRDSASPELTCHTDQQDDISHDDITDDRTGQFDELCTTNIERTVTDIDASLPESELVVEVQNQDLIVTETEIDSDLPIVDSNSTFEQEDSYIESSVTGPHKDTGQVITQECELEETIDTCQDNVPESIENYKEDATVLDNDSNLLSISESPSKVPTSPRILNTEVEENQKISIEISDDAPLISDHPEVSRKIEFSVTEINTNLLSDEEAAQPPKRQRINSSTEKQDGDDKDDSMDISYEDRNIFDTDLFDTESDAGSGRSRQNSTSVAGSDFGDNRSRQASLSVDSNVTLHEITR